MCQMHGMDMPVCTWSNCTLHKCAIKFLMPSPNMDYNQKCCALKLLPLGKQVLLNKCVLMQKVVHGKAPQYLKALMIPSEHLQVHGNKQLLRNSLAHHLRYPMEVKTFKRKAFHALIKPPWYLCFSIRQTPWHKMYCIHLACSCQVLHLYFTQTSTFNTCIFMRCCTLFHFPCGHYFNTLCILYMNVSV